MVTAIHENKIPLVSYFLRHNKFEAKFKQT